MLRVTNHEAIMLAANYIESHPQDYRFQTRRQPKGMNCGSPGCVLGWIAVFARTPARDDRRAEEFSVSALQEFLDDRPRPTEAPHFESRFYDRMTALQWGSATAALFDAGYLLDTWHYNPQHCAETLRKYAHTYHPVEEYAQTYHAPEQQPVAARAAVAEEVANG